MREAPHGTYRRSATCDCPACVRTADRRRAKKNEAARRRKKLGSPEPEPGVGPERVAKLKAMHEAGTLDGYVDWVLDQEAPEQG